MSNDESFESEMNSLMDIVKEILRTDVRARNNYLWLILQVWQKAQHIKIFIPYDKVINGEMYSSESITRACRKVQHDLGLYLPTDPEVIEKRKFRQGEFKRYFGKKEG